MQLPDLINGTFETFGALFIYLSIRKVRREKLVRGVSWVHVSFFSAWGYWNLFYYHHLEQWFSWLGGMGITLSNTIYMLLLVYYTKHPGGRRELEP